MSTSDLHFPLPELRVVAGQYSGAGSKGPTEKTLPPSLPSFDFSRAAKHGSFASMPPYVNAIQTSSSHGPRSCPWSHQDCRLPAMSFMARPRTHDHASVCAAIAVKESTISPNPSGWRLCARKLSQTQSKSPYDSSGDACPKVAVSRSQLPGIY